MAKTLSGSDESNVSPYRLLAVGIISQAVTDLRHWRSNPIRAFDASVWLMSDDATLLVEGALNMPVDHDYLEVIIGNL